MTEKVQKHLDFLRAREYRSSRREQIANAEELAAIRKLKKGFEREADLFVFAANTEEPVFYRDDLFGFHRMYVNPTGEAGRFGNVIPDYEAVLQDGLDAIYKEIQRNYEGADQEGRAFYDAVLRIYDAWFALIERYKTAAAEQGHLRLAAALACVPRRGASDYYEAMVAVKAIIFALRLINTVHLPFGRFDRYMKPYFERSLANGATRDELLELTELFFIDINLDTDLYVGIQQGDNGQSMVLGGCDAEGKDCFGELSELCLQASEKLNLIEPKINLRVNAHTPLSFYERGTRLTKHGLGFPQYCNDDVAIPFLTSLGYELCDARDYAVAACWELIIPAKGADIPNIGTVNFPRAIEKATARGLASADIFAKFMKIVREELVAECTEQMNAHYAVVPKTPAPLLSSMVTPCIARARDLTRGGSKYYNYGFHGAGISTAADAVYAIQLLIYEQKKLSKKALLDALNRNFEGFEDVREMLLQAPKMGNNDDGVDAIAGRLMDICVETVNGKDNGLGGICRMGTGSAMEYVLSAAKVGATADGRLAGGSYGCSFSPSPIARLNGPLSLVQSFTKYDLCKISNGGPFTIEIHDTVFRNAEGEKKTAALVKTFIDLGGHQIQINAINRDRLLRAQKHPEDDPNLIVRVWGWSGYFNELDTVYQDHIIKRAEFQV